MPRIPRGNTPEGKKQRWLRAYNQGAAAVPSFGLVRVVSVDSTGLLTVDQPNAASADVLVNSEVPIQPSGYGKVTRDFPAYALYDSADGTPAAGDTWGSGNGTYKLKKASTGFTVQGGTISAAGITLVSPTGSSGGSSGGGGGGSGTEPVNLQTGTSYTYLNSDQGKLVSHNCGSAVAATLPQAGASSQFTAGWWMDVENRGAGAVTITPTTSTIDGAASLKLFTDQGCRICSDGTNYYTQRGRGVTTLQSLTGPLTLASDYGINTPSGVGSTITLDLIDFPSTQVSGLAATAGSAQVTLNWTAPSPAVAGKYRVLYATAPAGPWTIFTRQSTASTSCVVTGLTNGTLYYFTVACETDSSATTPGVGPFVAPVSATPTAGPRLQDTFTDTNGTNLTAHTISPYNTPSTSWSTALGGSTLTVQSNKADTGSLGASQTRADKCDNGQADTTDFHCDVTLTWSATNILGGIFFRYVDDNNYWALFWQTNAAAFTLRKVVAGVATDINSSFSWTSTGTHTLKVVLSGSSITCYSDGSAISGLSTTDAFNNTATKFGVFFITGGSGAGQAQFDNFTVT